jgi:hypothetical protein
MPASTIKLTRASPAVRPGHSDIVGMCHIFRDSIEAFQAGFGPHAQEIMGDIPNYTDQTPVIQIRARAVKEATSGCFREESGPAKNMNEEPYAVLSALCTRHLRSSKHLKMPAWCDQRFVDISAMR